MSRKHILSALIAFILIISLAIPTFAEIENGDGRLAGFDYIYTVDVDDVHAVGEFDTTDDTIRITGSLTAYCWCSVHTEMYTNHDYDSGMGKARTLVDNKVPTTDDTPYYHLCLINYAYFKAEIGSASRSWTVYS